MLRDDINRDAVELWLVTRGTKLSTRPPRHPQEETNSPNRPGTRPNQDHVWLDAISSPDAQATNTFLDRSLKDLARERTQAYRIVRLVYTGEQSDPSLPERWRARVAFRGDPFARIYLGLLDAAFDYLLYRAAAERRILYWPSPDEAKAYANDQAKKQREARYFYAQRRARGDNTTRAVQRAANFANCSERAVWKWLISWNDPDAPRAELRETRF